MVRLCSNRGQHRLSMQALSQALSQPLFALVLLLVCLAPHTGLAAVSAQLSAQDIDELESVVLTIRASDTRNTEALDLAPLDKDFHVLGSNISSQYRFINGREQSWVDYQITLQPKRIGELTIPSIQVGRDRTPTLQLRVRRLSSAIRDEIDRMVFFTSSVSSDSTYVQAELVLTRRLYYSQGVQLYSDLPGPPELENAVVLTLGETTSGKVTQAGRPYGVIEQRYAIFPEASGTLVVPSVSITASVKLNENGRSSRKGVRVQTDEITVTIKPVPASYPADAPWLPATDVSVLQKLDAAQVTNVGDTLTHEFLVHIIGNVGSVAPPVALDLASQSFRQYPQSPVINDDTNGAQVVGARLQTTSIVPLIPGQLQIPAQTLYWWNTRTDTLEQAQTDAINFVVQGSAIAPASQQDAQLPETTPQIDRAAEGTESGPTLLERLSEPENLKRGGVLLLVMLIALLLWRYRARLAVPLKLLSRSDQDAVRLDVSDTPQFYRSAMHLLRPSWPQFRQTEVEASALLDQLGASLYGNDTTELTTAQKQSIKRAVQRHLANLKQRAAPPALPPLYRTEPYRTEP